MPWVRIDDQFPDHPKVIAVGPLAKGLYVDALCYANRLLTDGFIPRRIAYRLASEYAEYADPSDLIGRLFGAGLWDCRDDGYVIHDYLEYQPSAEKVKAEREANARRQADWRARRADARNGVSNAVTPPSSNGVSNAAPSQPVLNESSTLEPTARGDSPQREQRSDGQVYALVDAFAAGKGLAKSDIVGGARVKAFRAMQNAPPWATGTDIEACTRYLMSDPFWQDPGKLKAHNVVDILPEWRTNGKPNVWSQRSRPTPINRPASKGASPIVAKGQGDQQKAMIGR